MMLTRCPHCSTSFRIRPEQLRMRQGRVRCGHCAKPFNALEALLEEDGRTPVRLEDLEQRDAAAPPEAPPAAESVPDSHADTAIAAPPAGEASGEERDEHAQDKDAAPLFVLEEAVPDPQQMLPISEVDGEVPELYIDGFARQRQEPHIETPARTPQQEAPPDETPPGDADPFGLDFQFPPTPDDEGAEAAGEDGGLRFSIEEVEPSGARDDAASAADDEAAERHDAEAREASDFSIDFVFPAPAEPSASDAAVAAVEALRQEARGEDPFEVPTVLGDGAEEISQDIAETPPAAADDGLRAPEPAAEAPPAALPLRASEPEDEFQRDATDTPAAAPLTAEPAASAAESAPTARSGGFDLDEPGSRRPALWGLGIGMLAMLLAAQSAILFRNSVIQVMPESQPLYRSLCAQLGCDMTLPREAGYIAIGASDLHPDERRHGLYVLHTAIENRAPFQQALPHLELSLTDARDRAIARRVIAPRDWKPGSSDDEAFAAGGRLEADIAFAAADLKPVGYRVYAFYP